MEATISKFQFEGYKILKASFEMDKDAESKNLEFGFKVSGKIYNLEGKFQLFLDVKIQNKDIDIQVNTIGDYTFITEEKILSKEQISPLFYINSSALIFPYIRAYITTLTALSDNTTIVLPTLNLTALGNELLKNIEIID
jgi:preprotein translocase subunit SecB